MKSFQSKKILKSLLLAGFAATSIFGSVATAADFKGVYGGVEGGVKDLSNAGKTAVVGGVIGFRNSLSRNSPYVLGFEVDLGLYTAPSDFRYGVSSLFGYNFDNSGLLYARAGYSRFDGDTANLNGLVLGIGYEMPITRNINARLDYKNINYKDDNLNQGNEFSLGLLMSF